MFLEAQFGADAVSPIEKPKLPALAGGDVKPRSGPRLKEEDGPGSDASMELSDEEEAAGEDDEEQRQRAEIERLHKAGVPVPGVQIKVDKMEATVWLEDLAVECANKVLGDRVRAVVERAVEVIAPLW